MNSELEQKARNLLADEFERAGSTEAKAYAAVVRAGDTTESPALRAIARALEQPASAAGVEGWNEDGAIYVDQDSGSLHIDLQNGGTERQFSLIAQRRGSVKFALYVAGEGSWHGDVNDENFIPALRAYAAPKPEDAS